MLSVTAVAAEPDQSAQQWYVVLHDEQRVGYMHTSESRAEGRITTGQEVKLMMGRAGQPITITISSSFVETLKGEPIRAASRINMGGTPLATTAEFGEEQITITSNQAGRKTSAAKVLPAGDWLTPAAAGRAVERQLDAGKQEIRVSTLDVSMGLQVVTMDMSVVGRENIEVYGKTVPAIVWDARVSTMPSMVVREYVDAEGQSIKSKITLMPGMTLTVMRADEALATSGLSPAEMMASTLITPSRAIQNPRQLTRAVFRLTLADDQQPPQLPSLGAQRVRHENGAAIVTVATARSRDQTLGAEERQRFLRASPVLNHADERIIKLLDGLEIDPDAADAEVARRLRAFVHEFIDAKDLSVGFATASDVARTAQGDCTEHAVLLAAMLRGAGMPSRCVSGLVYVDQFAGRAGIFGYHMWTQAWLEDADGSGRWVDLDAALPGETGFDATHIAIALSDFNAGLVGNDMAALVPMLGRLDIEVVETEREAANAAR